MDKNRSYLGSITKMNVVGYGSFSNVYECGYFDYRFAYKEYSNSKYVEYINDNLIKLPNIIHDNEFVIPYKYIYKHPNDKYFLGYIMSLLGNHYKLCDLNLNYDEKINILKKAREMIDKLHDKYKILHTDLCPWNFLYNIENDDLRIIDFDTYIELDNNIDSLGDYYSIYFQDYGNKVRIDKDLDIYLFNLTTYALLNDVDYNIVLSEINKNNFGCFDKNNIRNIFESYKNLECNKSLKKEYVIDYL